MNSGWSVYHAVRFLVKDLAEYQQGKWSGNLVPKVKNVAKKHNNLHRLFANHNFPLKEREREGYTGQSYVHKALQGLQ